MNMIRRLIVTTSVLVGLAAPAAAAQEPAWVREFEAQIARHAEVIARAVEAHAGEVAQRSEQIREAEQRRREIERERQQAERERQRERQEAERERQRERQEAERERRSDNERNRPETTEAVSWALRLGRNGTLDLQNISGDIVITGGGGDNVRIAATKRTRNPVESQARAILQELVITVAERGGNIEVRTEYPRRRNTSASVDYTVSVPSSANVTLRTVSGDLRISNVNGDLRAESISGDVVTSSVRRVRQLKSVSGNLDISGGETEELSAATISGDIFVRNLKARALDLNSVSGDLRLTEVETERADLQQVTGSIEYSGPLSKNGRYEFQSHSGDIRITPAGNPGFDIEANSFSGTIRSEYPLKLQQDAEVGTRRGLNRTIRGTFGDGTAILSLRSFSGDIVIVRR